MARLVFNAAESCSQFKDLPETEQLVLQKVSRYLYESCGEHEVTAQCQTKCLKLCQNRHVLREKVRYFLKLVINRVEFSLLRITHSS